MIIFFTPNNIIATNSSSQGVSHSISISSEYHPIWYNYKEIKNDGLWLYKNLIDYPKLFTQILAISIVMGALFFVVKYKG